MGDIPKSLKDLVEDASKFQARVHPSLVPLTSPKVERIDHSFLKEIDHLIYILEKKGEYLEEETKAKLNETIRHHLDHLQKASASPRYVVGDYK